MIKNCAKMITTNEDGNAKQVHEDVQYLLFKTTKTRFGIDGKANKEPQVLSSSI